METKILISYGVLLVIFLALQYSIRIKFWGLLVKKSPFTCTQCGKCCRYLVELEEEDIRCLEKTGKYKEDFVEMREGKPFLRRATNGYCSFFRFRKDGMGECTVYKHRPKICRVFPKIKVFGKDSWDYRCPIIQKPKWPYVAGVGLCLLFIWYYLLA